MASAGRGRRGGRWTLLVTAALAVTVGGAGVVPLVPGRVERAMAESGVARIAHSEDGVLLRADPTFGAAVLGTLPDGAVVALRTAEADTTYDPDGVTRWWPVRTDAGDGWVSGFYLQVAGLSDGDAVATEEAAAAGGETETAAAESAGAAGASASGGEGEGGTGPVLYGTSARVAEPDGVNLRQEPAVGSSAVRQLAFDAVVELRIDEVDTVYADNGRWWPIRVDDQDGWVLGSYLAPDEGGSVAAPDPAPEEEAAAPINDEQIEGELPVAPAAEAPVEVADAPGTAALDGPLFPVGAYVEALTDDGTGLNIRADGAPDSERVGSIPEFDVVQVMDGPFVDPTGRGWYLITDGDVSGYVDGGFLSEARQPAAPGEDAAPSLERPEPPRIDVDLDRPGIATGAFSFPVDAYTFTQGFGCSPYWFEPWEAAVGCNYHNGVDLAAPMGTPLLAADGGVVEYSGWCDCGLGYYVKIDHENGFKTVYGHMSQLWVSSGEPVSRGEAIGAIGSTGNSTGPHVHFMLEVNGITQDPLAFLG